MSDLQTMIPALLREKLGGGLEPEEIVGYQYSIGYIISDWDYPIENYYCEKEEYWSDDKYMNFGKRNALEELEDLSRWDKELIGRFDSMRRGYFEQFYKADNGQWPLLRWACIDVYIVDGNNVETIRIETKDLEDVIDGTFEGLRLWLEKRIKNCVRHG